jgi:hypothetical protein
LRQHEGQPLCQHGGEGAEHDRDSRAEALDFAQALMGGDEQQADQTAAKHFCPAATEQGGDCGRKQKSLEHELPASPGRRLMQDGGELRDVGLQLRWVADFPAQGFQRNQPRHVVVVGRQTQHFNPPGAAGCGHGQGKKGQYRETFNVYAEALADSNQPFFQIMGRRTADVQCLTEITQKCGDFVQRLFFGRLNALSRRGADLRHGLAAALAVPKTACQSVLTAAMCFSISSRGTRALGVAERRLACCSRRYSR